MQDVVRFHCSAFVLITPLILLFSSFSGLTQEGVYRTVGSNIQVQKLLNTFFGKELRPSYAYGHYLPAPIRNLSLMCGRHLRNNDVCSSL